MLDSKKFILTFWDKMKIAIGIMCFLLVIVQIAAASRMISENNTKVNMIRPAHYVGLQRVSEVAAEIKKDDIILTFQGKNEEMGYYLVRVSDDHAVIMRTLLGSSCDNAMYSMLNGARESLVYKGRVNTLVEADMAVVNLTVLSGDLLYKKGMSRHVYDVILRYELDITFYETESSAKYIIATIVGAFIMLGATVWAFWKPFKKIGLSYAARMGKIELDLIKKEDLPVDMDWYTDENVKKDLIENMPERKVDKNFQKVDFYESGVNDEGNFYVKKKIDLDKEEPDEDGFKHEHKNY